MNQNGRQDLFTPGPGKRVSIAAASLLAAIGCLNPYTTFAADHGDTPLLTTVARNDAKLTDLYAFTRGDHLVIALCSNPAIADGVSTYQFPADLSFTINIDRNSRVTHSDPGDEATYGGTLARPERIQADVTFTVTFDDAGNHRLTVTGLQDRAVNDIQLFSGLRDDPFIRGPRIGKNVAAVVLEFPLRHLSRGHSNRSLLIWASAKLPSIHGPTVEYTGRAFRTMFTENDMMHAVPPSEHWTLLKLTPDVIIFNPSNPAAYPNGRELTDDVVDLIAGLPAGILMSDAPYPSANDVPFLTAFPYLAPPQ